MRRPNFLDLELQAEHEHKSNNYNKADLTNTHINVKHHDFEACGFCSSVAASVFVPSFVLSVSVASLVS